MHTRDLGGIAFAIGLVAVAVIVSEGWVTLVLSIVAGMCIGFVGWDAWRGARAGH